MGRLRLKRHAKHLGIHPRKLKKHYRRYEHVPHRIAIIGLFKFLYLTGLTFLILFLFSTQRPTELVIFRGTPYILFFIALILIIVSILELKKFLVTWRRTFRRIALFTLLPGILGIIVTISGESILTYLFKDIPLPIIESYLRSITPQLWILTVAYIVVSIFFYKFSQKFE